MNWNDSAPTVLGLEWFPAGQGATVLDSTLKMAAVSLDQTAAQAIGGIQIPNISIPTRGGIYAVDVYDAETAVPGGDVAGLLAVPNEDVSIGTFLTQAGSGSSLYATIDDGAVPNSADYIKAGGTSTQYTGRMNTAGLTLTNKRVLSVRLAVYCQIGATGLITTGINISGANYFGQIGFGPSPGPIWLYATWNYNPATRKPWTIADVQAFDSTDEWYVTAQTNASVWSAVVVYTAALNVYVVPETRIATGTLDDSSSGLTAGAPQFGIAAWNTATMTTPTGGTWTKDGAGRHLVTVRRVSAGGSMSVPYLAANDLPAHATGWSPAVDATWGTVVSMGSPTQRIMPLVVRTTVPADHLDSLPYTQRLDAVVGGATIQTQEISGAGAFADYGVLRFPVDPHNADAPLVIKVKRRSDNVQVGATFALTPQAALKFPVISGSMHLAQVQLSAPATLAAGTQYYVEWSSVTSGGTNWILPVLTTRSAGNSATYNGATDVGTLNGVEDAQYDFPVTLGRNPAAPSAAGATLDTLGVSESVGCTDRIYRGEVGWGQTTHGVLFERYEIERSEDSGITWVPIAWLLDESMEMWHDYEARRGVAALYRIRVVRTDGAASSWSTGVSAVTKPTTSPTLVLTSNQDPSLSAAYDYQPQRSYKFHDADEQVTEAVYGRDYQLGFQPSEWRGATAKFTLLVAADDRLPPGGMLGQGAFNQLRILSKARNIPYVCVLDHLGNRWMAQMRVPEGEHDGGIERHIVEVSATELTADPYVVHVTP